MQKNKVIVNLVLSFISITALVGMLGTFMLQDSRDVIWAALDPTVVYLDLNQSSFLGTSLQVFNSTSTAKLVVMVLIFMFGITPWICLGFLSLGVIRSFITKKLHFFIVSCIASVFMLYGPQLIENALAIKFFSENDFHVATTEEVKSPLSIKDSLHSTSISLEVSTLLIKDSLELTSFRVYPASIRYAVKSYLYKDPYNLKLFKSLNQGSLEEVEASLIALRDSPEYTKHKTQLTKLIESTKLAQQDRVGQFMKFVSYIILFLVSSSLILFSFYYKKEPLHVT